MKQPLKKHTVIVIFLVLLAFAGSIAGSYYYWQYQQAVRLLENPAVASEIDATMIFTKIGKLMDLPKDEQPTFATVTDATKLRSQPFFVKAQNNDRVLIYTKAKEAILYRPSSNMIINVGPISIGSLGSVAGAASDAVTPTPAIVRIALYNGTTVTGLTKTVERKLTSSITPVSVVAKINAAKSDYLNTLVIPLTTTQASSSSQIAHLLGGRVASLPSGETKPTNADIVVIVGKSHNF